MMMGLVEGEEKMSKSNPAGAIFIEDSEQEIKSKIKCAFCPPMEVAKNPCLEYLKYIVFPSFHKLEIKRAEKNGGDK